MLSLILMCYIYMQYFYVNELQALLQAVHSI